MLRIPSLPPRPLLHAACVLALAAALLPAALAAQPSRTFTAGLDQVWSALVMELAEQRIPVDSQDKDAGVIRGQYILPSSDSNPWVSRYTTQKVRSLSGWTDVQINYAFFVTRRGTQSTEVKLDLGVAVFNVWTSIWRSMLSNGTIEREMFDEVQGRLAAGSTGGTAASGGASGKLVIASRPDKADVEIDGRFVGQTPATLPLSAGEHEIKVTRSGYRSWTRTLEVLPGSETSLEAALEKKN